MRLAIRHFTKDGVAEDDVGGHAFAIGDRPAERAKALEEIGIEHAEGDRGLFRGARLLRGVRSLRGSDELGEAGAGAAVAALAAFVDRLGDLACISVRTVSSSIPDANRS